jgi:hypothetical protein
MHMGDTVIAKFSDGYFYGARLEGFEGAEQFRLAWEDGCPASWVPAKHMAVVEREPVAAELSVGLPVLALYNGAVGVKEDEAASEEGAWFAAKVVAPARDGVDVCLEWARRRDPSRLCPLSPLHRASLPPRAARRRTRAASASRRPSRTCAHS